MSEEKWVSPKTEMNVESPIYFARGWSLGDLLWNLEERVFEAINEVIVEEIERAPARVELLGLYNSAAVTQPLAVRVSVTVNHPDHEPASWNFDFKDVVKAALNSSDALEDYDWLAVQADLLELEKLVCLKLESRCAVAS